MRTRVAVIGGGRGADHGIALASATDVAAVLDPARYDVIRLTQRRDGEWTDGDRDFDLAVACVILGTCDLAIPLVSGHVGADGMIAALCDLVGVPYVGSGVAAGMIATDRVLAKIVAESVGVTTAPGVVLRESTASAYAFTHPVIVKPARSGSSLRACLVNRAEELRPALGRALSVDDRVLVEDRIRGRDVGIAVLGGRDEPLVSAPVDRSTTEAIDGARLRSDPEFPVAATMATGELSAIQDAALRLHDAIGCSGVTRFDFFVTWHGLVLGGVDTVPDLGAQSAVARMFAAADLTYADLVERLVDDVLAAHRVPV